MTDNATTCRECGETLDECGCERCGTCGGTLDGECECES